MPLNFIILFPSRIIRLEIAFTKVSILLTVNEIASATIITDKKSTFSFNNKEKKARSGTTKASFDTAIKPENHK